VYRVRFTNIAAHDAAKPAISQIRRCGRDHDDASAWRTGGEH
jgi:hypothetical protein